MAERAMPRYCRTVGFSPPIFHGLAIVPWRDGRLLRRQPVKPSGNQQSQAVILNAAGRLPGRCGAVVPLRGGHVQTCVTSLPPCHPAKRHRHMAAGENAKPDRWTGGCVDYADSRHDQTGDIDPAGVMPLAVSTAKPKPRRRAGSSSTTASAFESHRASAAGQKFTLDFMGTVVPPGVAVLLPQEVSMYWQPGCGKTAAGAVCANWASMDAGESARIPDPGRRFARRTAWQRAAVTAFGERCPPRKAIAARGALGFPPATA